MMTDFLVFQLYGVLASWGDIAVGEDRPSLGHPTKSAMTGLLAAALGLDRADDTRHRQLTEHYGVAVCVRSPGEILRDYHTVQVPGGERNYSSRSEELTLDRLSLKTILSKRYYRNDALYQVAIWAQEKTPLYSLATLRERLCKPQFCLYLGRKSCPPSLPLCPVLMSECSLKQAFDHYPHDKARKLWPSGFVSSDFVSYYWESGLSAAELGAMDASMVYPRRDRVHSRKRWQFANRNEFYYASTTVPAEKGVI